MRGLRMYAIISLAELESCLQRRPWQTQPQLEEQLGGSAFFALDYGISLGTIIERERNKKIEYANARVVGSATISRR